jgi:hypothetical protein
MGGNTTPNIGYIYWRLWPVDSLFGRAEQAPGMF